MKDNKEEIVETESQDEKKWEEQFLRVSADFQNFRRRTDKERLIWISEAQIKVIDGFLPVLDELELAIKSVEAKEIPEDLRNWADGFKMIQKNLYKRLADLGVKEIDCSGMFDPKFHEALMQVESSDHKSGEIVSVLAHGYMLNNEVIRHAKVSVAK